MSIAHFAPLLLAAITLGSLGACAAAPATAPAAPPVATTAAAPVGYQLQAIRAVGKHKGDYLPAHNVRLELDGRTVGTFESATGAEAALAHFEHGPEVVEYKDGNDAITHKHVGKPKYGDIVLRRVSSYDPLMLDLKGDGAARKSGSVIYLDRAGAEVLRFAFVGHVTIVERSDLEVSIAVEAIK